jgi:hypothetical protein
MRTYVQGFYILILYADLSETTGNSNYENPLGMILRILSKE